MVPNSHPIVVTGITLSHLLEPPDLFDFGKD
jgi:hypothetical protein